MKPALATFAVAVLAVMIVTTCRASLHQNIWDIGDEYWGNPWTVATLIDAYFAFSFFTLWILYKERTVGARLLWVVIIALTGSMGMAVYLLIQLARLGPGDGAAQLLAVRRPAFGSEHS